MAKAAPIAKETGQEIGSASSSSETNGGRSDAAYRAQFSGHSTHRDPIRGANAIVVDWGASGVARDTGLRAADTKTRS